MISSVTGERARSDQLTDPSYWAMNMTHTVQFVQAITVMCEQTKVVKKIDRSHLYASVVDHLVEVGPHAALQGPLRDILRATPRGDFHRLQFNSEERENLLLKTTPQHSGQTCIAWDIL